MMISDEEKPLVLIVDDNATNIDILVHALKGQYRLGVAKSGEKALEFAVKNNPQLILLDIMMPGMNGYETCRRLKNNPKTCDIAVIFITAIHEAASKTKGFDIGAVDYITKPFNTAEVKARVRTHLSLRIMSEKLNLQNVILQQKVAEKTAEIENTLQAAIKTMAQMAESRDPYTAGHQQRVAQIATAIAEKLSFSDHDIEIIRIAGVLHDIGKFRIPVDILNRPGKILKVEYEMLKIHPEVGYDLLKNIPFDDAVAQIVYQHHEKLDGSGYPKGLKEDEILPEAKVLAVADVVEAMNSHRPYRPALGRAVAMKAIAEGSGTLFDPDAVEACRILFEDEAFNFSDL